jgi:hypothetical protein
VRRRHYQSRPQLQRKFAMWFRSWLDVLGIGTQPRRSRRANAPAIAVAASRGDCSWKGLEAAQLLAFLPAVDFPFGANPVAVVAADFNDDGHLDLATASLNWGGNDVSVALGNGDGTFQAPNTTASARSAPSKWGTSTATASPTS